MKVRIEKKKTILYLLIILFLLSLVAIAYLWLRNRQAEIREEISPETIVEPLEEEELDLLDSLYLGGGCEAGKEQYSYEEIYCKMEEIKVDERTLTVSGCRLTEGGEYKLSETFVVYCEDSSRAVTPADVYSRAREEGDVERMRNFYDAVIEEIEASEEEKFLLLEKFREGGGELTFRLVEKEGVDLISSIIFSTEEPSICQN